MTMHRKETTVNELTKKSWADLSESAKQDICGYYVGREVQQCVSMLVSSVLRVAGQYYEVDSELETDTLQEGFCGYDYSEAAEQHIHDCDYLDDLLDMADEVGYRDEAMLAAGYDENNPPVETPADPDDPESEDELCASFDDFFYSRKAADQEGEILDKLRRYILDKMGAMCDDDVQNFCNEFDIDFYDYPREVYEYWVVSDWMADELKERGYLVTEWMGLTIWGRQCTGQAILLDYVISSICSELYNNNHYFPDDLLERNNG